MTITEYSSAIVDGMLGWLKGLASWVLKLFNLAGSAETSPLMWLSRNWLQLLVLLMLVGVAGDIVIWLVRWRPHWVWFRKERVIVDDERFFNMADIREDLDDDDEYLEKNWAERDYVVASTLVSRRRPKAERPRRVSTRRDGRTRAAVRNGRRPGKDMAPAANTRRQPHREPRPDMFGMDGARPGVTDVYEDEVFNVNNLPRVGDFPFEDKEA